MRIYSGMSPNVRHVLRVACHLPILVMRPKKRHVTPRYERHPFPGSQEAPTFPLTSFYYAETSEDGATLQLHRHWREFSASTADVLGNFPRDSQIAVKSKQKAFHSSKVIGSKWEGYTRGRGMQSRLSLRHLAVRRAIFRPFCGWLFAIFDTFHWPTRRNFYFCAVAFPLRLLLFPFFTLWLLQLRYGVHSWNLTSRLALTKQRRVSSFSFFCHFNCLGLAIFG